MENNNDVKDGNGCVNETIDASAPTLMYLGVKMISAVPRLGLNNKCIDENQKLTGEEQEGYKVTYEDGYISWSPKDVFEKAYRRVNGLTFGLAIEALKQGKCLARNGWNGKGMFVCKQVPSEIGMDIVPKMQSLPAMAKSHIIDSGVESIHYQNQMIIVKPNGDIDSWVPSVSDIFAEDWYID